MRTLRHLALGQTVALQYLTVGLGIGWSRAAKASVRLLPLHVLGRPVYLDVILTTWIVPAGIAVIALVVRSTRLRAKLPSERRTYWIINGLIGYAAVVGFLDPFMWVAGGDATIGLFAVAIVMPPFLCFRHLIENREWLAAAALVLLLATCIASMLDNARHYWGGSGFFRTWRS